jgi:TetR/AcrR family transcriptional regulator, regulator of cefoperazone and chloramphenicol sensitivity
VRSATLDADLTAKARIRDAAMSLFAADGVAGTSVRAVADAVGVSPGLVIHHFGSKEGLRRAVDEAVVERFTLALREVPIDGSGPDLLQKRGDLIAGLMRSQPTLCDYIGRVFSEGSEASSELFHLMFVVSSADAALTRAGALRADSDEFWRAIQQMLLIIGPLMLRPLIERELGGSLLEGEQFDRWMRANVDLLARGLYAPSGRPKRRDG